MEMPPELVARFGPLQELGRGACGVVYRLGTDRALKVVPLTGDGAREARELELAQGFRHPHLMPCFEAGILGGAAWAVMPRAQGSLEDLMDVPAERDRAWRLLAQAARGVAALHEAGVVHRDLKPANILLVDGEARVADFGMARGGDTATLTATGTILGTPRYMAPEQARGERATPASDLFALGVIAYELVEGGPPYPAGLGMGELLGRVAAGRLDPVQRSRAWLPAPARAAIEAALAIDPEARPSDAARWADQLGELPPAGAGAASDRATLEVGVTAPMPKPVEATVPLAPPRAPAARAEPAPRRAGALPILLVVGLVAGMLYQGRDADAPQTGPAPAPTVPVDPSPLAEHPDLGAATRALDEAYEPLVAPFLLEESGTPRYSSALAGAEQVRREAARDAAFRPMMDQGDYLTRLLEYLILAGDWIEGARKHLTGPEQESDRVVAYAMDRVFLLPYVHYRMLRYRMQDGADFAKNLIAAAGPQLRARDLAQKLEPRLADFYRDLPGLLGDRPWPIFGVLTRLRVASTLGRRAHERDVRDLIEALGRPLGPVTTAHLVDAAAYLRRASEPELQWPGAIRWALWTGAATALPRQGEEYPLGHDATLLVAEWHGLSRAAPADRPASAAALLPGLRAMAEGEAAWLESRAFQAAPDGTPVLATEEETLRAYRALRNFASLGVAAQEDEATRRDADLCRLRGRIVTFLEGHRALLDALFEDRDDTYRTTVREMASQRRAVLDRTGCPGDG